MTLVLLATYNGARWLPDFLASLRSQTHKDWQLLVRDDGSTDETVQVLDQAAKTDSRITRLCDSFGRQGVAGNFNRLMGHAISRQAEHFAFADQDDVWLPRKLQWQQNAMHALESQFGAATPLLVHTDLCVTDASLREIHPSHTAYARIYRDCPMERALRVVLSHNFVTGCASLMNRALLEWAWPVPQHAILHDWWLCSCAAAVGKIHYLPVASVLYRQHGGNVVGAAPRPLNWRDWRQRRRNFANTVRQAKALRQRLLERDEPLSDEAAYLLNRYTSLLNQPALRRIGAMFCRLRPGRPGIFSRALHIAKAAVCKASD